MNILLFAGTTEGRVLAERLAPLPVDVTICVATEYGGETLAGAPKRFAVRVGRLDADAMPDFMRRGAFDTVVDATHPYARQASANIHQACETLRLPYLRLLRDESERPGDGRCRIEVDSAEAAAGALAKTEGAVLLTTGSKDLSAYTVLPDFAERIYPRVLPSVESIRACEELGYRRSHIIAMQGPFSRELNLALMREYSIRVLVTKDGGAVGGFWEKMLAAEAAGALAVVIGRPREQDGLSLEEVFQAIVAKLGETT